MKCVKQLQFIFLLLFFFVSVLPVFSQVFSSKKEVITGQLSNIKIQLINLKQTLQQYNKQIEELKTVILSLERELTNSQRVSEMLKKELENQKELLTQLTLDYQNLQETYNQLLKQSTELSKQLKNLEVKNKILIGGVIALGAVSVIEFVILMLK